MLKNVEYVRAKTGSEIARELDISRQAVSQSLKRGVIKVYKKLLDDSICDTPTEAIIFIQEWFGIQDEDDIQQFLDLFPKQIKDDIKTDARIYSIRKL